MGYSNDKPAILDAMPAELASALLDEVGGALFDNWYESHLNDGQFIADYEIALLSDNKEVKAFFNKHWEVEQGEEHFLELEGANCCKHDYESACPCCISECDNCSKA